VIVPVAEAKRQFSTLLKRAAYGGETITIGTRGRPEAALISVGELERRAMEMYYDAKKLEHAVRTSKGTVGIRELLEAAGVAEEGAEYGESSPKPVAGGRDKRRRPR
jgi:prevent-host-death family protein